MDLDNIFLLLGNEPSPAHIPHNRRLPSVVASLVFLAERNELEDPPEPSQAQLVVDGGQGVLQLMMLL